MHSLKQNKRAHIESETGKNVPAQGWKPSTVVWALCLLVRKYSRPKTHPYEALGVERLHMRLPFLASPCPDPHPSTETADETYQIQQDHCPP